MIENGSRGRPTLYHVKMDINHKDVVDSQPLIIIIFFSRERKQNEIRADCKQRNQS